MIGARLTRCGKSAASSNPRLEGWGGACLEKCELILHFTSRHCIFLHDDAAGPSESQDLHRRMSRVCSRQ